MHATWLTREYDVTFQRLKISDCKAAAAPLALSVFLNVVTKINVVKRAFSEHSAWGVGVRASRLGRTRNAL